MKIFCFIASRQDLSHTKKISDILIEELKCRLESDSDTFSFSQYQPCDLQLQPCSGCQSCFRSGICSMDSKDGFLKIKKEILSSDVVILGTPVYAASVSSDMKLFIDRLSYWLHLMPLAGKLGIPIVTTGSNSINETSMYLKRIMQSLGLFITTSVTCTINNPNMFDDQKFWDDLLSRNIETILQAYKNKEMRSSAFHERFFSWIKETFGSSATFSNAESIFWANRNINEVDRIS